MFAYKGFGRGFVCRGYRFLIDGWNEMDRANCARNGFHAATNPLDCLTYYPNTRESVYAIVECSGDMDEDNIDSKITCTRMRIVEEISLLDLIIEGIFYATEHPKQRLHAKFRSDEARSGASGFALACGNDPRCRGDSVGDILGYAKTKNGVVTNMCVRVVDGMNILPGEWYKYSDIARGGREA